jgi:hypothetical protein
MEKFSIMAGCAMFMLPFPLFQVNFPSLPGYGKAIFTLILAATMAACGLIGGRRPWVGMLILPICFFGITSIACWWFNGW